MTTFASSQLYGLFIVLAIAGVGSSRAPCMISHPPNAGLGSSRGSCMISQPPNVLASAVPQAHDLAPAVLPLVNERSDATEPARSPVCGPTPPAYARTRTAPRARACCAPPDSSIPVRNVGGAPTSYVSLGRCNRVDIFYD